MARAEAAYRSYRKTSYADRKRWLTAAADMMYQELVDLVAKMAK